MYRNFHKKIKKFNQFSETFCELHKIDVYNRLTIKTFLLYLRASCAFYDCGEKLETRNEKLEVLKKLDKSWKFPEILNENLILEFKMMTLDCQGHHKDHSISLSS